MKKQLTLALILAIAQTSASFAQTDNKRELFEAGLKATRVSHYAEAEKQFRAVLSIDKADDFAIYNLAAALMYQNKFEESLALFKDWKSRHKNEAMGWMALAGCYKAMGNDSEAIKCLETLVKEHPQSAEVRSARVEIQRLKQEIELTPKSGLSPENYFAYAIQGGTVRFPLDKMPIKVYIKPGDGLNGYNDGLIDTLKQSFDEWQTASEGLISFTYVSDPASAQITIGWIDDISKLKDEGGLTILSGDDKGIQHAKITFLTLNPKTNKVPGASLIKNVHLHEIGHALGINGHSPQVQDVMFSTAFNEEPAHNLSSRDKNTILALYRLRADQIGTPDPVKMSTTGQQVEGNADSDMVRLNAEALAASRSGNYKLAASKLERAHQLVPGQEAVIANLVSTYLTLAQNAVKQNDTASCDILVNKTISLAKSAEDRAFLKSFLEYYQGYLGAHGMKARQAQIQTKIKELAL